MRRFCVCLGVGALIVGAALCGVALAEDAAGPNAFPQATLADCISGKAIALTEARGTAATVLVCMSIDCPISNEFVSTLVELCDTFKPRGVAFVGINPNAGQELPAMAAYAREHKLNFPLVKDPGGKVARQLLYSVTPEVRVYDATGKLAYSGRIDNRYRVQGGQPGATHTPELANALEAVLAGKPVNGSKTKPVGCPLQMAAEKSPDAK